MTDLKYQIIEKLYHAENRTLPYSDLLNQFLDNLLSASTSLNDLAKNPPAYVVINDMKYVELTPTGVLFYETSCEEHKRTVEAELRSKKDRRLAILSLIVTILSILVTIVSWFR